MTLLGKKTKTVFLKDILYPSLWILKRFILQSFPGKSFCTPCRSNPPQYSALGLIAIKNPVKYPWWSFSWKYLMVLILSAHTLRFWWNDKNQKQRSSRPEVFCKKGVRNNFTKFRGKHLCQSLFFDKAAGLRPSTLLKKKLWHSCFPVNFLKLLRMPFSIEQLSWLLLQISKLDCTITLASTI